MPDPVTPVSSNVGWCIIPGQLLAERGAVWLREPAWADRTELVERLRNGSYGKPFVVDDGETRRLHFSLDFVQSEMRLGEPSALTFRYTRKMMAFLLFQPRPRQMVLVGLGGGSLTKFCHRQLPRTHVTTVEVSPEVIAFGELFDLPPPERRMRLVQADARDFFAESATAADVILLDGCDRNGTARELCSEEFYGNLRARLHPQGLAVINVTGPGTRARAHLRFINEVFEGRVIVVDVQACGNRLAFAFNGKVDPPDWQEIARRADGLKRQHGLDFQEFARLLRRAYGKKRLQSKR